MRRLSRKKSKRMSLRKKHTVVRKVADASKKLRKEARRMSRQGIKRPERKDPGIPNTCPNKKQLLEEMEVQRKLENDHKKEVRLRTKQLRDDQQFDKLTSQPEVKQKDISTESLLSSSDVILEILDAQDPSPSPIILTHKSTKTHIFVLNKIDLVPEDVSKAWFESLSNIQPTFLYKCVNPGELKVKLEDYLLQFAGNTIAVVGYPNVGKSSVINTLKGYRVAGVTSVPGGTKKVEEHKIGDIVFCDSPGIEIGDKTPAGALRTATRIESLSDPYTPVHGILEKVPKEKLLILYAIPDFSTIKEFLTHVSKKLGKLSKGGVPDFDSASKQILHDWFTHKIPHFTPCSLTN